jgi:hypothetical protein
MDPLTLSLLGQAGIAAAGTAIGALPDIRKSDYERAQARELEKLKREQELGMLGLTEQERARIENMLAPKAQQSQAFAQAERQRLTGESTQFGRELLAQQMADETAQRRAAEIDAQILQLDLQKQAQQEQQIRDLEAAQGEYQRRRQEALVAPLQAGAEAAASALAIEKLLQLPPQRALPMMQQQYGLSPAEAQVFYGQKPAEQFSSDYLIYQSLLGGK